MRGVAMIRSFNRPRSKMRFGALAAGMALALFFGGDAEIKGDGHAHPCVAPWDGKGNR